MQSELQARSWLECSRARPAAAAIPAEDGHVCGSSRGSGGLRGGRGQHPRLARLPCRAPAHPPLGPLRSAHGARELLCAARRRHRRRRAAARHRAASERRAAAAPRATLKVRRVPSRRVAGAGAAATAAAAATGREVASVLRQGLAHSGDVPERGGRAGAARLAPRTDAVDQARLERP